MQAEQRFDWMIARAIRVQRGQPALPPSVRPAAILTRNSRDVFGRRPTTLDPNMASSTGKERAWRCRATRSLPLRNFQKRNEFFIGIDSDGCAFDTMEVKHKECFIPNIIKSLRSGRDLRSMPARPPSS